MAKNTITRHGAPSEDDLVEVLGRHDGEIEMENRPVQKSAEMRETETCEGQSESANLVWVRR